MDVVYAVDTAQVPTEECGMVLVRKGEHWPANDPVVRAQPSLFSTDARYGMNPAALQRLNRSVAADAGVAADAPVEQATAAPGEKRNVRRG